MRVSHLHNTRICNRRRLKFELDLSGYIIIYNLNIVAIFILCCGLLEPSGDYSRNSCDNCRGIPRGMSR